MLGKHVETSIIKPTEIAKEKVDEFCEGDNNALSLLNPSYQMFHFSKFGDFSWLTVLGERTPPIL